VQHVGAYQVDRLGAQLFERIEGCRSSRTPSRDGVE
jgi:hypothetical protein